MSWQTVQDAIQAGIAAAARIDPKLVLWAFQDVDEPPVDDTISGDAGHPAYFKISLPSIATVGQDWIQETFDATRAAGQEFQQQVQGLREVPLEVQCFTASTADGRAAAFVLEAARTALLLPSVRAIFASASVSPFDPGPVQNVPEVVAAGFRGRATCTIRCYIPADALAEYVGYITQVSGTITTYGSQQSPTATPYTAKL